MTQKAEKVHPKILN